MNTPEKQEIVTEKRKPGRPKGSGPKVRAGTPPARQIAAAILEVMAGQRMPSEAAAALSVSLPRYYAIECRALEGLVKACEPAQRGRQRAPESEIVSLRKQVEFLERENMRKQALVRAAQRAVGLPEPSKVKIERKRRRRKAPVRALRVAAILRQGTSLPATLSTEVMPEQVVTP